MGFIKINNINLSPTLTVSKVVIVSHRKKADPDIPASYTIDTSNLVVPVGGILTPPFVIGGLDNGTEYTVKVKSDCGNYFFEADFKTGTTCPDINGMTASAMRSIPESKCEDCLFELDGVVDGLIGKLTAGVLTSDLCVIADYIIDWYLNDETTPRLTSGSDISLSDDITVLHPFANEPVQGGTWHPRIRSVEIEGQWYSAEEDVEGSKYSPDLKECLPTVAVQNFTCANGGNVTASYVGGSTYYDHKITYSNVNNSPTLATRSLKFVMGATKKYIAWHFLGLYVPDTVIIKYVSPSNNTTTDLERWTVGFNLAASNILASPNKLYRFLYLGKITSLMPFTYADGDYITVDIVPNGTTSNTDWEFCFKCLEAADCNFFDSTQHQITAGSVAMAWNPATCSYDVTYNKPVYNLPASHILRDYTQPFMGYNYFQGGMQVSEGTAQVKLSMRKQTNVNYQFVTSSGCTPLTGSCNVIKVGNVITATYNNATDYNFFKTQINNAITNAVFTNYSADPTNINHYKWFIINLKIAASCGDASTLYQVTLHYLNPPVFDDANQKVTMTLATMTNGYPQTDCDYAYNAIDTNVFSTNYQVNRTAASGGWGDFNVTTFVKDGIGGYALQLSFINELDKRFRYALTVPSVDVSICDLAAKGWTNQFSPYEQFEFSLVNDRVVITDQSDPPNNFKLYRAMDASGIEIPLSANYIKIYEISGGVVVP